MRYVVGSLKSRVHDRDGVLSFLDGQWPPIQILTIGDGQISQGNSQVHRCHQLQVTSYVVQATPAEVRVEDSGFKLKQISESSWLPVALYALYASKLGIPILLRLYFRLMWLLRLCTYGSATFSATSSSDKSESKNEWNVCIETSLSLRVSI